MFSYPAQKTWSDSKVPHPCFMKELLPVWETVSSSYVRKVAKRTEVERLLFKKVLARITNHCFTTWRIWHMKKELHNYAVSSWWTKIVLSKLICGSLCCLVIDGRPSRGLECESWWHDRWQCGVVSWSIKQADNLCDLTDLLWWKWFLNCVFLKEISIWMKIWQSLLSNKVGRNGSGVRARWRACILEEHLGLS